MLRISSSDDSAFVGNERPQPRLADQIAFVNQVANRLVGGHSADVELLGKLLFRWNLMMDRIVSGANSLEKELLDL